MSPLHGAQGEPSLDASYVHRAAPPGSLRYFALLYAPPEKRDILAALYVIEAEIRDSAHNTSHDVAHTRLQWWRGEVDRLVNAVPQHPATRALRAATASHGLDFSLLHELLVAADMDLACMTYANEAELRAYTSRCGGIIQQLSAQALIAPAAPSRQALAAAERIGSEIRHIEVLQDLRKHARQGRVYTPLEALQAHDLTPADLQAGSGTPRAGGGLERLLGDLERAPREQLTAALTAVPEAERAALRPILVLGALHLRLLAKIAQRDPDMHEPIALAPLERVWVSWRAARRAR